MEKVKLKSVIAKEYNGKTFYNITTEDGRIGSSYDEKFLENIGKEVEVEVKDSGKEYQGAKQYYFSFPKTAGGNKGFPAKDYKFSKQDAALNHAINAIKITGKEVSSKGILALADEFYVWFNSKQ